MPLNKRPSKNPNDELARNKKLNEAIKKYENIYNYNRAVEKAARRWGSLVDDFFEMKVDQEWKDLWNKQQKESNDKFDSGEDDAIESYERDIRWLKGAIRKIKAERQVADVNLDDMIMDLEDKIRNPKPYRTAAKKPLRKNPVDEAAMDKKQQEAVDRLGGEHEYDEAAGKAYQEWKECFQEFNNIADDAWKKLWGERPGEETIGKYSSGEINIIEYYKMRTKWLKDAIRQIKAEQNQMLDDMIMDLESKVEDHPWGSGSTRKNPPDEDGRTTLLQERLEEAREALEASVGGDLRELKDEFIIKANRRYPNWDINDVQKIKYYQYLTELHKGEVSDELLNEIIMDLEDKIRNPKPSRTASKSPRKNPRDDAAIEKKRQEAIDRLGGEDEYYEAVGKAFQEWRNVREDFDKVADEKWQKLWREQFDKCWSKYGQGEINEIEYDRINTQWLRDAIRQIKNQQIQDVDLDDMIMDLESKVEDHPRGSRITRKNPTPISVLRLRENNGDDEYWERLYKIRAARGQAEARWVQWVKSLPLGRGLTMAAIERQANFLNSQPKVNKYSDERLEQIIEETNFYERDIIENS